MRLHLQQYLPAVPRAVWPWISEPELMSQWSEAPVEKIAAGDGDPGWSIGTLRRISIQMGRRTKSFEEVVEYSEPPARLVYRVVSGLPVRYHRGELILTREGEGTRLTWIVDYRFPLPGMAQVSRAILVPQLKRSLRKLARLVEGAPPAVLPKAHEVNEEAELAEALAEAEAVLVEQRDIADRFAAVGDSKQWFARVYEYVTECQIRACREGRFLHPAWVLRIIPRFHFYFRQSLDRYLGEAPGYPEAHWRSSFQAMDKARRWKGGDLNGLAYGIAKGMQAHIEEDLPRTLAEVYFHYYRERCAYGRFRADYLLMRQIFEDASKRLISSVPSKIMPLHMRVFHLYVPPEVKDPIMSKLYYDIARERGRSFERGERLAALMGARSRYTHPYVQELSTGLQIAGPKSRGKVPETA